MDEYIGLEKRSKLVLVQQSIIFNIGLVRFTYCHDILKDREDQLTKANQEILYLGSLITSGADDVVGEGLFSHNSNHV